MTKEELFAKYGDVKIGVVNAEHFKDFPLWSRITAEGIPSMWNLKLEYRPRCKMELDTSYRQPIPYILIRDISGRYFTTRRISGDSRLVGQRSLGVGGHIDEGEDLYEAAFRELFEELNIARPFFPEIISPLGVLVASETEVDKVHVGMVMRYIADEDVSVRETDTLDGCWMTIEEIKANLDEFESWSKILVREGALDIPLDFNEVARAIALQYRRKNADYGNSVHETHELFGATAGFTRISDKISRMKSLESGIHNVMSESLFDTMCDAATYAVMLAAELTVNSKFDINSDAPNTTLKYLSAFAFFEDTSEAIPFACAKEAKSCLMEAYYAAMNNEVYAEMPPLEQPAYLLLKFANRMIGTVVDRMNKSVSPGDETR